MAADIDLSIGREGLVNAALVFEQVNSWFGLGDIELIGPMTNVRRQATTVATEFEVTSFFA